MEECTGGGLVREGGSLFFQLLLPACIDGGVGVKIAWNSKWQWNPPIGKFSL